MTATTPAVGHAVVVADTSDLDRPAWLDLRRQGIGGSDVSAIVGLSKWSTPLSVWLDKSGLYTPEDDPSEAMEWGSILEPVVADEFSRRSGIPTTPYRFLLAHPEHPWMLANVDRLITADPVVMVDEPGIYEGKTVNAFQRGEWGTDEDPKVPDHAALQAHHYLAVTGLPYAYVAVLIGGQRLVWRRIERDEDLISRLIDLEWEFWQRVEGGDPPAPTEEDASLLGDLWTPDPDSTVVLSDAAIEALARREQAKAEEKAAKARAAEAQAQIQLELGEAEYGVAADGTVLCSWKRVEASERKATVVAAHRRFVPTKRKEG